MLSMTPRWLITSALPVLVIAIGGACTSGARSPQEGREPLAIVVSPSAAAQGGEVRISATGFPPNSEVILGFGPPNSEYEEVRSLRADARGRVETRVQVPEWADAGQEHVFVVAARNSDLKAVSDSFLVNAPATDAEGEAIRIEGRITDEGVECPALRTPKGELYTLAGAPDWLRLGDEVVVRGTIAEMSFCMQGTTISVRSVERQEE